MTDKKIKEPEIKEPEIKELEIKEDKDGNPLEERVEHIRIGASFFDLNDRKKRILLAQLQLWAGQQLLIMEDVIEKTDEKPAVVS